MEFKIFDIKKEVGKVVFGDDGFELKDFADKKDEESVQAIIKIAMEKGLMGSTGDIKREEPIFFGHQDFIKQLNILLMGYGYRLV